MILLVVEKTEAHWADNQINISSGNHLWTNVEPNFCRHMESLGQNELPLNL